MLSYREDVLVGISVTVRSIHTCLFIASEKQQERHILLRHTVFRFFYIPRRSSPPSIMAKLWENVLLPLTFM